MNSFSQRTQLAGRILEDLLLALFKRRQVQPGGIYFEHFNDYGESKLIGAISNSSTAIHGNPVRSSRPRHARVLPRCPVGDELRRARVAQRAEEIAVEEVVVELVIEDAPRAARGDSTWHSTWLRRL